MPYMWHYQRPTVFCKSKSNHLILAHASKGSELEVMNLFPENLIDPIDGDQYFIV